MAPVQLSTTILSTPTILKVTWCTTGHYSNKASSLEHSSGDTSSPSGRIAEVVGGRITLGTTLGLCGVMSILCPAAASLHPYALAAARLLMGLLQGPATPALYCVIVRWARQEELTTMILVIYSGMALGVLLGLGCTGFVAQAMGWQWVFYSGGIIALTWTPFWFLLVRDCPTQHPFISDQEKQLLSGITIQPKKRVPWSRLFRTPTIYCCMMAEFSLSWLTTLTCVEGPTFFANQMGMSPTTSSAVMMVTTGLAAISAFFCGWVSDALYRRELLSKLAIRRLIYSSGLVVMVVSSVGLVLLGCRQWWVAGMFALLGVAIPLQSAAYQVTPMDIAPNYSGTIIGLVGIGQLGAFLSPIINSHLIPLKNGWNLVILVTGVVQMVLGAVYVFGITDKEQEWNMYEEVEEEEQQ